MEVRWTEPAAEDFYSIVRYIHADNPTASLEVATTIFTGCESLAEMPYRGRPGQQPGTRELLFLPLPYIAVYRIHRNAIEILYLWHGAQAR